MGKNFLLPITYYPKRLSVVPPTRKKRVGFPTIFCEAGVLISQVVIYFYICFGGVAAVLV